jgi:hypothetical protein
MRQPKTAPAGLRRGLLLETFADVRSKLEIYRFNEELLQAKHQVLSYVQGLRFSALLIYSIRKILAATDWTASWGVVLGCDGRPSPECDIILHGKEKHDYAWNGGAGGDQPIMDFRFVASAEARLVISCKSTLSSINKNIRRDARGLRPFVDRIWLFAENCDATKVKKLTKDAQDAGYERMWYLYGLQNPEQCRADDQARWCKFAGELKRLAGQ